MATTVAELIEALQKHPLEHTVTLIIDGDAGTQMVASGGLSVEHSDINSDEVLIVGEDD